MYRNRNVKLILFFTALTVLLTWTVIFTWERVLRSPFYAWVEKNYPGPANFQTRWDIEQRTEHFFISVTVDVIVVTLLLRLVNSQQHKLRESEKRYRKLVENSQGLICTHDLEGTILSINPAATRLLGYNSSEMIGRNLDEFIAPQAREGFKEYLERISKGPTDKGLLHLITKDGQERILVYHNLLYQEPGHAPYVLGHAQDITERQHAEEALRDIQTTLARNERIAALGRVTAHLAHELKNPIAGLRLYSLHLKSKVADKLSASEMSIIDKIIGGINHLSETAENVLTFARPMTLTRHSVDHKRLVRDAIQLLEPQLAANNIKVNLDLSPSVDSIMIDEAAMRATLVNLIVNSIQAMSGGGELTISSASSDGMLQLAVADTGRGMTPDQIKQVFEPFYTTKSQGLGLGMSYALKVVERHGGSIQAESNLGEGARISITLPMEEKSNAATAENSASR
jgi:PAS domain S-box-containing protein